MTQEEESAQAAIKQTLQMFREHGLQMRSHVFENAWSYYKRAKRRMERGFFADAKNLADAAIFDINAEINRYEPIGVYWDE